MSVFERDLFSDDPQSSGGSSLDEMTFSVHELNCAARDVLQTAFAHDLWVQGEVQRPSVSRNGHTYFQLVERDETGNVRAAIDVACWAGERRRIEREARDHGGLQIEADMPIRIRGRVTIYPAGGKFQFTMTGVDVTFTTGVLEVQREKLLRQLSSEGLLDANGKLVFPVLPLRLALITSVESAAYHDTMRSFEESGFSFRITVFDAQVQGKGAPESIVSALQRAERVRPDVVVLVRGGGSRGDLMAFDHELVARAIAGCAYPVLVGIGHEIDTSVADMVAHTAAKTPTAAAQVVIAAVAEARYAVRERQARLVDLALSRVDETHDRLTEIARRMQRVAVQRAELEAERFSHASARVRVASTRVLRRADADVATQAGRTSELGRLALRSAGTQLDRAYARLRLAPQRLAVFAVALDGYDRHVRALDPRRVLSRGYSITTVNGRALRSIADVAQGAHIHTELVDGSIVSTVETTTRSTPEGDHAQ